MKKTRIIMVGVLAVILAVCLLGGCNTSTPEAPPAAPPSTDGGTPATEPPAQTDDGIDPWLQKILTAADQAPYGGIQPDTLNSRAHINKGLPTETRDNITIGWTIETLGSPFFLKWSEIVQEKCAGYGITLDFQNADGDIQRQVTQMETFITLGHDAIMVTAFDMNAIQVVVNKAVEAGIPVFAASASRANDETALVTNQVASAWEAGFEVGVYAAQQLYKGETLKFGFAATDLMNANNNSRPSGFISGYIFEAHNMMGQPYSSRWEAAVISADAWIAFRDKGPQQGVGDVIDLVGMGIGTHDPSGGQAAISDVITANPDIDIIMSLSDTMISGCVQEAKQHNLVPGQDVYFVAAADGLRECMDMIKEGTVLATSSGPPNYHASLVDLIHDIFYNGYDANNLPANSYSSGAVIHAGNVDQFYIADSEFCAPGPFKFITIDEWNAGVRQGS